MPRGIRATGIVERGVIHLDQPQTFKAELRAFDGQVITIRVDSVVTQRSLAQNAWLWSAIYPPIADHTGFEAEELHEYFKRKFLPKHVAFTDGNGEVIDDEVIGGSSARLSTVDFSEFCERIRQWAAERLGIAIEDPATQVGLSGVPGLGEQEKTP